MSNPIAITPPRVPFLDPRTGDISRQWYLLILAIVNRLGGAEGASTDDLALGTMVSNGAPNLDALLQQLTNVEGTHPAQPSTHPSPDELALQPAAPYYGQYEDVTPTYYSGDLGGQNSDNVRLTGGTINNISIGATTPSTGKFTTLAASGQITSTLATGTSPFVITSSTEVANLNVAFLKGFNWDSPAAIGNTAQNTITGSSFRCPFGGTLLGLSTSSYLVQAETASVVRSYSVGNNAATYGSYEHYAATSTPAVALVYTAAQTGFKVQVAFACNGATPQTPFALGAAAVDLATVITLANNLRDMSINNGTGS